MFGGYSPFGVALAASAPFPNLIAVTAGTIVGSLLPGAVNEGFGIWRRFWRRRRFDGR